MGRVAIVNDTGRPDEELRPLVEFALRETPAIEGSLAIRLRQEDHSSWGYASTIHHRDFLRPRTSYRPKWAGRAEHWTSVAVPAATGSRVVYNAPQVCGHATLKHGRDELHRQELSYKYAIGERRFGRWPIYVTRDPAEHVLHTLAHELWHVLQFDRRRRSYSEVDAEVHAERVIAAWREEEASRAVA